MREDKGKLGRKTVYWPLLREKLCQAVAWRNPLVSHRSSLLISR